MKEFLSLWVFFWKFGVSSQRRDFFAYQFSENAWRRWFFLHGPGGIWAFPKIGVFPLKMDGENNGKPYFLMDDLGVPLFSETSIWLKKDNIKINTPNMS